MVGFFTGVSAQDVVSPFYRKADLVEIGRNDRISHRVVGFDHPHRQMLILSETYSAGASTGEPITHAAQESGVIVKGAVQVTVDGQSRVLEEGDGYYFDSRLPHSFTNVHDGESRIVSAITPPTY
ncbi:cupin domain-containing protein [Paracoccus luteus]|uniref:cupin domain-containing protein n=1 Tax=Paracoccus luteus TaxID=2508543 RepID=UPI001C706A5D|nr:cupin domain-containing protein [Paracoccus luteus]